MDDTTVPIVLSDTRVVQGMCTSDDDTICALEDHFSIDVSWRDANNETAPAQVVPGRRFFDGGEFYFLNTSNSDLLVQLLDACSVSDHFWVFASSTTDVEVNITVTDTVNGVSRTYFNPLGT